jgi:hypothetical protein
MFLKGFELSDDDELPHEQDPGQSANADNECPDMAMLEPIQPQVPAHPAVMPQSFPPFDFNQCIRRLGGNATTMFKAVNDLDSHIPPGPIIVHSQRAGGGVR